MHQAVLYRTADELVATAGPVLHAGLQAGHHVVAVVEGRVQGGLRDWLGPGGAAVEFASPEEVFAVPAQTMVAARRRWFERVTASGGAATVVGQHRPWMPSSELAWWDAAFNVVLAGSPVTMLCACSAAAGTARRVMLDTHPWLRSRGQVAPNPAYRDPFGVLADHPPEAPPDMEPCGVTLSFSCTAELTELRGHVARYGRAACLAEDRIADLVLAVSELAANSIEHGAGHGTVHVCAMPGAITVDVRDPGRMRQSLPGLRRQPATSLRGRGLWLSRELCDAMHVWHTETGTGVRIRVGSEPEPARRAPGCGPSAR